jgi:hypothetical protein
MYGRFHSNPGETPPVSLNRKPYLNCDTLHNTNKQRTHDLPCPPNLKVSAITVRRMIAHDLRNTEMHFFNVTLIIPCGGGGGGLGGGGGGGG